MCMSLRSSKSFTAHINIIVVIHLDGVCLVTVDYGAGVVNSVNVVVFVLIDGSVMGRLG